MPRRLLASPRRAARGRVGLLAALAAAALAAGCGDKSTEPPPPDGDSAAVAVSPKLVSVIVRGTRTFTASVTNLADPSVTWRLQRATPTPTGVDLGAIVSTGPASAIYTAPERVEGIFAYRIHVVAVSVADTTVRDTAEVSVPKVAVSVIPGSLASVLPGTLVPYTVRVDNTTVTGFQLYVQGVPGGDETVGTWTQTGDDAAIYEAPPEIDPTTTLDLLVRSTDDTTRFATATITLRRGFPLPVAQPGPSQYAPAWSPTELKLAYVQGGPPWQVAVYDFAGGGEQTLATLDWAGASYDGRLSWSDDGARLAFSEIAPGGQRAIGVVDAAGGARVTFAPEAGVQYYEAAFIPERAAGAPDSLVVALGRGAVSELRAYPVASGPGEAGRLVYAAPAGVAVRWVDVITRELVAGRKILYVAAEESDATGSDVVVFADDGAPPSPVLVTGGTGRRSYLRWAWQLAGPLWITYIWDGNRTAYRVLPEPAAAPARLYSEFFPELGSDLSLGQSVLRRWDAHALSRLAPSGQARLWVVEFPPQSFGGVPRPEELELASMGIRGALSPSSWARWLGGYTPRLGRLR